MSINKMVRRFLLSKLLIISIIGLVLSPVAAESLQSWVVRSEYQSPVPGRGKTIVWWQFESRRQEDGGVFVAVTDLNERVQTRAEFYYDQNGALAQADCYRERRGEEVCDARRYDVTAPAIMNQSLIPGDWLNPSLPFVPEMEIREYLVKVRVGSTVFASNIQVSEEDMGLVEAQSLGMLNRENESLVNGRNLYLITVNKLVGSLPGVVILRQLWMSGDNFWLYEEKAGRRSWRCQIK